MYGRIYSLHDPVTGELRYIGQTTRTLEYRLAAHVAPSSRRLHSYVARWLLGLGDARPTIRLVATADSRAELDRLEIEWIAAARAGGVRLVNLTDGGGGCAGYVWSPEQRERLSVAQKGKPRPKHTEEWKRLMAAKMTGRKMPAAHGERIRAARLGTTRSEETKVRISAKKTGAPLTETQRKMYEARRGRPMTGVALLRRPRGTRHPRFRHEITPEFVAARVAAGQSQRALARELGTTTVLISRRLRQKKGM